MYYSACFLAEGVGGQPCRYHLRYELWHLVENPCFSCLQDLAFSDHIRSCTLKIVQVILYLGTELFTVLYFGI